MVNCKINFIYQSTYQILLIFIPFITVPYIARVLGTNGIGIFSYSSAIVSYFTLIAMLGIRTYGNREVAKRKINQIDLNLFVSNLYFIHFIIGIIVLVLYLLFVHFLINKNQNIFLIQTFTLIASIFDINWLFFGLEKFKLTVTRNIIIKLLSVLSIFVFVKTDNDVWIYAFIMTLSTLLEQIVLWLIIKKYISFVKPDMKIAIKLIRPMFLLFIPSIAINIYKQMDKIMLGIMSSYSEIGIYEYAEKLVNVPVGLISALGIIMMPRMANLYATKQEKTAQSYIISSLLFIMFMSCACSIGLIGISRDFVPYFFGEKFIGCISVILWLSLSIIFIAWANVIRTQYLLPKSKDKIFIISIVIGACVNIIINFIFIPILGAKGAAIGTLVTECTVCMIQTYYFSQDFSIRFKYLLQVLWFVLSSFVMLYIIKFISTINLKIEIKIILEILFGGIVYLLFNFRYCIKITKR